MSEKIYGIDMGTNAIKIYQKGAGVILHQKNMIAVVNKKDPLALGDEAHSMYEKAPKNIQVKKPIINGVIADFTANLPEPCRMVGTGTNDPKMPSAADVAKLAARREGEKEIAPMYLKLSQAERMWNA